MECRQQNVDIASDGLSTEADKVLNQLCAEVCARFSETEAAVISRAVFYDAVAAAAKGVANSIGDESEILVKEILAGMLKNPTQHPYVESTVVEESRLVARNGAYAAIRRWSENEALPRAEAASRKVLSELLSNHCGPILHTTALANIRTLLQSQATDAQELPPAEKERLVSEYLTVKARATAEELASGAYTSDIRRQAQKAAEQAVEEIAGAATAEIARKEGLDTACLVANDLARLEISRLVMAEVQRRAARLARERLQEEAPKQEDDKRAEYCQEEAIKIAEEAINAVTEEIADPSVADLDLERARELSLSAASAVAREFANPYPTEEEEITRPGVKTLVLLGMQIFTGGFIVWFFLLGGYELCQPALRAILPDQVYQCIYRAVPNKQPAAPAGKNKVEVDDLLDENKSTGNHAKEDIELELSNPKPESSARDESVSPPPADTRSGAAPSNTQKKQEPAGASPPSAPETTGTETPPDKRAGQASDKR